MKIKVFMCLFVYTLPFVYCQDDNKQSVCVAMEDCKSCLSVAEYCVWCDDYNFIKDSLKPPCIYYDSIEATGCPEEKIVARGVYKTSSIDSNEEMIDFSVLHSEKVHQIQPQKVTLGLIAGTTRAVEFTYRVARNYPLDLYYLMDLTWSMRDDKETLLGLGDALPAALQNLTKFFRFGFGSFAEKPLMPYTHMDAEGRRNPCIVEHATCLPTYTFTHSLSMTSNVKEFINVVGKSAVTGNVDNTEAGLDALMQVAVCEDRIGWSPTAHRVVILTTDGLLHFAGNGKLGGVVRPTDEKCHLDENGNYVDSTLFDYPAPDQMYRVLREKKISVIFAVTENRQLHYQQLHDLMPENTFVGSLEADSSNILNLLNQGYQDLFSSVNFVHNAPANIDLKFYSNCGKDGPLVETSRCSDIKIGEKYKFVVNITLTDDVVDSTKKTTIIISDALQIGQTGLTLDIDNHGICNCKPITAEVTCSKNSKYVCGKCICLPGWLGANCDCKGSEETSIDSNKCIDPKDDTRNPCSNNGDCICGVCNCDKGFHGQYCGCRECQKSLENGAICGGAGQGVCDCGICKCMDGWSGSTCSCQTSENSCLAVGDTIPCSGQGTCTCGECQCDTKSDGEKFIGKYCQTCPSCDDVTCSLYELCARCSLPDKSLCIEGVCKSKSGTIYIPTETEEYISISTNLSMCHFWVSEYLNTCKYTFTYEVQKNQTVYLNVSSARGECNTMQLANAYGVFLAIIIGGIIAILILKCIQVDRDRRAYSKFISETNTISMTGTNPLYKSPITEVRMPEGYDRTKKQ